MKVSGMFLVALLIGNIALAAEGLKVDVARGARTLSLAADYVSPNGDFFPAGANLKVDFEYHGADEISACVLGLHYGGKSLEFRFNALRGRDPVSGKQYILGCEGSLPVQFVIGT
jgi:hypothetical protein